MANDYGNLGMIMESRGDLNSAREHWAKALDLYQRIGMPDSVERVREWLDAIGDIRTEDAGSES
ncbi:MAG: tetratricopeptide repeat protein [Planctomycetes bacterium]|nr:tetratricopeptide repeat protein [Planctomycetota bacterium]